jgi:hypothetical protein
VLKRPEPLAARLSVTPKPQKTAKSTVFQRKTRENRKNPVETGVLPLTNAAESRKVNGGRFFRTRVIIGFGAYRRTGSPEVPTQQHEQAT